MAHERACDDCGRSHPIGDMAEVATDYYVCDICEDISPAVLDHLVPERRPGADDTPTLPPGAVGDDR